MANNEFVGSIFAGTWTTSTGTTTLNTDFRNFVYTPTIDLIDATAGADTGKRNLASFVDSSVSCEMLGQSDLGSAFYAEFSAGKIGTLTWGPAGGATTKVKHTLPAICMGCTETTPYKDVVTLSVSWKQTAAETLGSF